MAAGTIATTASPDALKLRELKRMQAIATGLLVAMAFVFVAASLLDDRWPALAYVRAFAEAAMVGACADWFAFSVSCAAYDCTFSAVRWMS